MYCEKLDDRFSDCKTAKTVIEPSKILSDNNFVSTVQGLDIGPRNAAALKLA